MKIIDTFTGYRIIYHDEGLQQQFYDIGGSEMHVFRFEVHTNFHFVRIGQYLRRLTYSMIVWVADDISGTPYYWAKSQYYVSLGRASKVLNIGKEVFLHPKGKFVPSYIVDRDVVYLHVKNLENTRNIYRIREYESFPSDF